MTESDIIHETENLWCIKKGDKYEIMLQVVTHSYKIGEQSSLDSAKRFMERMEKYPKNLLYLIPAADRYQLSLLHK